MLVLGCEASDDVVAVLASRVIDVSQESYIFINK